MMYSDILLVDDDAVQATTRRAILERTGYSVSVAGNGHQAMQLLDGPDGLRVRLLITDHSMPSMNGPALVKALRASGFEFPILVLSGFVDAEDEYEGLDVSFQVKPFPPDQLIAFVHDQLNSYELRSA